MLVRSVHLRIRTALLVLLPLAGCAEDTRDPECVAAIESADRCGLDTSSFTCPDAGEADAFESCGYPCFSNVEGCSEFGDPESAFGICLTDCIARYGSPPPEPPSGELD